MQRAVPHQHLVDDGRRRRDEVHVVLALEPLLHDIHVQQAEETAAKAEPQSLRNFRLVMQRRVVELELVERVAQRLVLIGFDRVEAREHLRLDLLETRQRRGRGAIGERHGVADLGGVDLLDAGDDEAYIAGGKLVAADRLGREHAHLFATVDRARRHQQDLVLGLQHAVDDPHQHHHADVIVEPGIDDERTQRRIRVSPGRRHLGDHRLQNVLDADAVLGTGADGIGRVDADDVLDFGADPIRVRGRQVDLVEHGNDFHALLDGGVAVGHRLRLDALRCVHDQQRAFARGQRARHLIGEVNVPGRVDQVERVDVAVAGLVGQCRGLGLDRDSPLALEVHRVQDLFAHLPIGQAPAALDEAVGQRGFPMVDVGDDRKIADTLHEGATAKIEGHPKVPRSMAEEGGGKA